MEIVTLRHSRCFENGNDDFGVEAFWAIHCAHWSSGFMVLNASISGFLVIVIFNRGRSMGRVFRSAQWPVKRAPA